MEDENEKENLAAGLVLLMSLTMLSGCGDAKKDYKNDIEEFAKLGEVESDDDDIMGSIDKVLDALDDLDIKTSEGKDILKDMKELMELSADMMGNLEELESMDDDKFDKMSNDFDDLNEKVEDDVKKFREAAEDAGLDDSDLKDLDSDLGL